MGLNNDLTGSNNMSIGSRLCGTVTTFIALMVCVSYSRASENGGNENELTVLMH